MPSWVRKKMVLGAAAAVAALTMMVWPGSPEPGWAERRMGWGWWGLGGWWGPGWGRSWRGATVLGRIRLAGSSASIPSLLSSGWTHQRIHDDHDHHDDDEHHQDDDDDEVH